jgi:hypothetical protein
MPTANIKKNIFNAIGFLKFNAKSMMIITDNKVIAAYA